VAAKAEAAIAEMREYVRVCGSLTVRMERIISLADKVGPLAPDEAQALLRQNGSELRYVVKKVLAEVKALPPKKWTQFAGSETTEL